jgi:hypothetical protein
MVLPEDMGSKLNIILALRTKVPEKSRHSMVSLDMRLRNGELISIEVSNNFPKEHSSFKNL